MKRKKIIFATALIMLLLMTGCGNGATDQGDDQNDAQISDLKYEVEDVFALIDGGVVVVGYVQSGTMRTGDSIWLIKEDGTKIESSVLQMELYDSQSDSYLHPDVAEEGTPIAVMLEGLEKDQIDIGDLLIGNDE